MGSRGGTVNACADDMATVLRDIDDLPEVADCMNVLGEAAALKAAVNRSMFLTETYQIDNTALVFSQKHF